MHVPTGSGVKGLALSQPNSHGCRALPRTSRGKPCEHQRTGTPVRQVITHMAAGAPPHAHTAHGVCSRHDPPGVNFDSVSVGCGFAAQHAVAVRFFPVSQSADARSG